MAHMDKKGGKQYTWKEDDIAVLHEDNSAIILSFMKNGPTQFECMMSSFKGGDYTYILQKLEERKAMPHTKEEQPTTDSSSHTDRKSDDTDEEDINNTQKSRKRKRHPLDDCEDTTTPSV